MDHATNAGIDAERSGIPDAASTPTVDLPAQVEAFIRAMHQSRLTDADAAAAGLKRVGRRATDHVQGLVLDQMPPTFDDIPPPLVQGFLKELLSRLG